MKAKLKRLLSDLVKFQSITPEDAKCQSFMIHFLEKLGFTCQRFDNAPVSNFYAQMGQTSPLMIFAGHTDVVPVGNESLWKTDPFLLHEENGYYYGRGTADMKGSLACMLLAAEQFVSEHHDFKGSLGFLITSGEEGDEFNKGTPYVMQALAEQGIHPTYCIVGEPSSTSSIGDMIKVGRRGSLTGKLQIVGKQGHVAYPHLAENPIHNALQALNTLVQTVWDKGNRYFPPTSFQITHVQAGGQANNVIPGDLTVHFNFRYSTEQTADKLKQCVLDCLQPLKTSLSWQHNGEPFLTTKGRLVDAAVETLILETGQSPELSTSGGTSDGRFIAPYGVEVIELGPVNATIHQVNECVAVDSLETLTRIYLRLCEHLLLP